MIRQEIAKQHALLTPASAVAGATVSMLVVLFWWDHMPNERLLIFAAAQWLAYVIWFVQAIWVTHIWHGFPSEASLKRCYAVMEMVCMVLGLSWGVFALLSLPEMSVVDQSFLLVVLAGVCAGSLPVAQFYPRNYALYLLAMIVPLSVALFTTVDGERLQVLLILVLLLPLLLYLLANYQHRVLIEKEEGIVRNGLLLKALEEKQTLLKFSKSVLRDHNELLSLLLESPSLEKFILEVERVGKRQLMCQGLAILEVSESGVVYALSPAGRDIAAHLVNPPGDAEQLCYKSRTLVEKVEKKHRWLTDAFPGSCGAFISMPIHTDAGLLQAIILIWYSETQVFEEELLERVERLSRLSGLAIEHIENKKMLDHLAHHDPLTNLPNRLLFRRLLEQHLKQLKRCQGCCTLLFIDIDKFKAINDQLGHHIGDRVLVTLARRMKDAVRESDIVARWAGDEFVVLLLDVADQEEIRAVSAQIIAAVSRPIDGVPEQLHLGCSIGASIFHRVTSSGDQLIEFADSAMYEAKRQGGNKVVFDERTNEDEV